MVSFIVASSLLAAGCAQFPNLVPKAEIESRELTELSGIAPASPGQYWGINDSGHPPILFRFNEAGEILEKTAIEAGNVDWEGMTKDAEGRVYVADFGDNNRRRGVYTIYRVSAGDQPEVESTILFRYEDGASRNCEAIFAFADRLYLISKEDLGKAAEVFRIDLSESATDGDGHAKAPGAVTMAGAEVQARRVGALPIKSPVTDAAYSPERREIAVLTYLGAQLFHFEKEEDLQNAPVGQVPGIFGICEGIAYTADGELLITNEPGTLWKIPLPDMPQSPTVKSGE